MLTMATIKTIRDAYFLEGKTISEIATEYGYDRKTVRKYINQEDWNEGVEPEEIRSSILDEYKPIIDGWLEEDRRRRKKQRHTATRVYNRLCEEYGEEGFTCSYRTVAAYVAERKKEMRSSNDVALPLEHKPGEAQVDFGEADFIERGKLYHGYYLSVSFPNSNAGFLQLFKGQDCECFVAGMIAIFLHIMGVPVRLWFDNASIFVTRILRNGKRNLTERFLRFMEHFGFQAVFCNPDSGHEKGNVENKIGYHRRNLLVPIPEFDSLEEYNKELLLRCDEDNKRVHYRKEALISELFCEDKASLLELPRIEFDQGKYVSVRTDAYAKFSLCSGRHWYSTAPKYAKSMVRVRITAYTVTVFDENLREIVTHQRLYGDRKQERMDWLPYLCQLARRPSALKYSPMYDLMPDPLRLWIDAQPRSSIGTALGLIARLSKDSDFHTACAAVSESIQHGISDGDSLVALYDRMRRYTPLEPRIEKHRDYPETAAVRFDPHAYDKLLGAAGGRE